MNIQTMLLLTTIWDFAEGMVGNSNLEPQEYHPMAARGREDLGPFPGQTDADDLVRDDSKRANTINFQSLADVMRRCTNL